MARTRPGAPIKDRILCNSTPVTECGCWIWSLYLEKNGYGRIKLGGRMSLAHRVSWEAFNGPIPNDLQVLHKCDTPPCVNHPDHLFLGTNYDNVQDKERKGRARPRHGTDNGRAKLNPALVRTIRASSDGHSDLGRRLGVTPQLIYQIRLGQIWRHLP